MDLIAKPSHGPCFGPRARGSAWSADGVYVSTFVVRSEGKLPGSKGDAAARLNHSAFAGNLIPMAKSGQALSSMPHDLVAAIAAKLHLREEQLQLWSNFCGEPITLA